MKIKDINKIIIKTPRRLLKNPNILNSKNDKADKLFNLILNKKVNSEEKAIKFLYPNNKYPHRALWKTKEKVIERFTNNIISSDFPVNNGYSNILIKSTKNILKYKFLYQMGLKTLGIFIAEQGLKFAIKNEISRDALFLSEELRRYHSNIFPSFEKITYYNQLANEYASRYKTERLLDYYFSRCSYMTTFKVSLSEEDVKTLLSIKDDVERILARRISDKSNYYSYVILSIIYIKLNDHDNNYKVCQKAAKDLQQSILYSSPIILFHFKYTMCISMILKKSFKDVEQEINKLIENDLKENHPFNKTTLDILKTYALLHQRKYQEAYEFSNNVKTSYDSLKERLQISKAFAALMVKQPFRVGKLINEANFTAKDKQGLNINIQILEVLGYLVKGQYDRYTGKIQSLERYKFRYLNQEGTFRSSQFFSMLTCIDKGNFKRQKVCATAQKYHQALISVPLIKSKQDFEIEVVPYEDLWNYILKLLPE